MPRLRRVHIIHEGHKVATNEDEPDTGSGKHALGDASHSGLRHFAIKYRTDDPEIDIFMSPDHRGCHLVGSEEEHRFMVGMYRQISMPEAEFMLSNESMDDLTIDLVVSGIRAIMLVGAASLHHGLVETELHEKVSNLERAKADLNATNK
jgi:hypothetical protein